MKQSKPRNNSTKTLFAGWLFAVGVSTFFLGSPAVDGDPSNSPSARAAAKLKYHPPKGWIRHYLPDDRYKIAGGIWKVTSTESAHMYHRANCPSMLKQPGDEVIGFASASEAEDAGYTADPYCQPNREMIAEQNARLALQRELEAIRKQEAQQAAPAATPAPAASAPAASGDTPPGLQAGNTDKRGDDYDTFRGRAGKLSRSKGQQ